MTHQEAVETFATERYLLNEMSEADRAAFEEHYFSCEDCAQDVKAAEDFRDGAREVLRGEQARRPEAGRVLDSTRRAGTKWYRSAAVPWALAASLAGFTVFQLSSVRGTTTEAGLSSRVLNPVTIRPDSRGTVPLFRAAAGSEGITLQIDINGVKPDTDMIYDIKDASGRTLTSDHAPAPAAGVPLYLLLAARPTAEPVRYVVSFRDSRTGQPIGDYPFDFSK